MHSSHAHMYILQLVCVTFVQESIARKKVSISEGVAGANLLTAERECFSHKRSVRVFPIDCCAQTKLPHMISRFCVCMSEMVRSSKVMGVAILTCLLTCASLAARTHTTRGLAHL